MRVASRRALPVLVTFSERDPLAAVGTGRHIEDDPVASDDAAPICAVDQARSPAQLRRQSFEVDALLNAALPALRTRERVAAEERADGLCPAREKGFDRHPRISILALYERP